MHTFTYLESWPMVIDTECRSFATRWNDYYSSSRFLSLFSFLFPSSVISPSALAHREYTSGFSFSLYLGLLPCVLSPSFTAVTIFLPDTRGIIRTGSLLAWRFVGEAILSPLRQPLFLFPLRLMHGRVSYARRGAGKERKTEGSRRNDEKTKRKILCGCQGRRWRTRQKEKEERTPGMVPSFG